MRSLAWGCWVWISLLLGLSCLVSSLPLDVGLPLAPDLLLPLLVNLAHVDEHGLAHNLADSDDQAGVAAVPEQHGEADFCLLALPQIMYSSY